MNLSFLTKQMHLNELISGLPTKEASAIFLDYSVSQSRCRRYDEAELLCDHYIELVEEKMKVPAPKLDPDLHYYPYGKPMTRDEKFASLGRAITFLGATVVLILTWLAVVMVSVKILQALGLI